MTRHGLNATNSSVYSYHERKRDQQVTRPRILVSSDADPYEFLYGSGIIRIRFQEKTNTYLMKIIKNVRKTN